MTHIKIKDREDVVKDSESKAILSKDTFGLLAYKAKKRQASEIKALRKDINILKEEVRMLKGQLLDTK